MKYTDKQNYRIYKTQIEPQLINRIVVYENNPADEVKIQKLLGTYKEPQ